MSMDFEKELEKQFIKDSLGYSEEEWYKNHNEKFEKDYAMEEWRRKNSSHYLKVIADRLLEDNVRLVAHIHKQNEEIKLLKKAREQ